MKKKKTQLVVGGLLVFALMFYIFIGDPVAAKNERDLGQAVKAIRSETAALNDLVPFEWDKVYTFDPYTTKEEIEGIIGFKSGRITETVSEGMTQLLFVKGNKVVCDICGYGVNLGYSVSFFDGGAGNGNSFQMIQYGDNAVFSVERADGILVLTKGQL